MPRGRPKKYHTEEERKEADRTRARERSQTKEGKASAKQWRQSAEGKAYMKEYRQSEKYKALRYRHDRKRQLKQYGITPEDYNKMFAEQEGYCAICGRHQSEFKRRLSVDHNDETGAVRELLCGPCNMGIGQLQHDPERLRRAALYLEKHDA